MEIKVERIDGANAKAEAKVLSQTLEEKQKSIAAKAAKTMKIDGFRPGKVPAHVVMSRHGDQIKQDAEQEALQTLLGDALKELDAKPESVVGEPQITKFDRGEDGIEVEVKISFRPEVNIEGYKELIPEYKTPRVLKKDIQERLDEMLKLSAPMKELKTKREVKEGDFVQIDFEGFKDGEPFEGGKAEKYSLEIGSKSFIPGFEEGVVGMKPGEEKEIEVVFPENYQGKDLAGKPVVFKVKLHAIQAKDVPKEPDEETLKKLLPNEENPTVEMLEAQIKEQLKGEKLQKVFSDEVKPKFIETILEKAQFDLPDNIVDQEIDMQVRNIFNNLSEEEIKVYAEDPKKIEEKRAEYKDEAIKSVKLTFIVDALAQAENIKVEDQEVMQMIYFEAMQQGQDPKAYYEHYEKQGVLPAIKMSIIEERLFNQLFNKEEKGA